MKFRKIFVLVALVAGLLLSACQDDFNPGSFEIGEGIAELESVVFFKDMQPALENSRSAGNLIRNINHVTVLVYTPDGNTLVMREDLGPDEWEDSMQGDSPDTEHGSTEPKTHQVSFKLKTPLSYGRYRIYCIANMPELTNEQVATVEAMRGIRLKWNESNVAANNQMFGYFTAVNATEGTVSSSDNDFEAPIVVVNRSNVSLSSWIRRAASKVTIAYDGSGLYYDVYVYLQKVTLKQIPRTCLLAQSNTVTDDADLIADGEEEVYSTSIVYDKDYKPVISNGIVSQYGIANYPEENAHSEESNALYFFENMQGPGVDKAQDADKNGEIDSPGSTNPSDPDYKDRKPYGTYIEVEAYYRSANPNSLSEGKIIYRFMLGKDIHTNYDAIRNHHFKVTLKFKGYANDVDWHIEYDPEPGIHAPDPYYISYLYDQDLLYPVQVDGMPSGCKLYAEIKNKMEDESINNTWFAQDEDDNDIPMYTGNDLANSDGQFLDPSICDTQGPWNGFLSLRKRTDNVPTGSLPAVRLNNQTYWTNNKIGSRDYEQDVTKAPYVEAEGNYSVQVQGDGKLFHLPLYTRQRNLVPTTGYTGNNPYMSYLRKAEITFTVRNSSNAIVNDSKGKPMQKVVTIYQVRRIVNPKGIWRSAGCDKEFNVELMHLRTPYYPDLEDYGDDAFESFNSEEGPWSAIIENGGWFSLSTEDGQKVTAQGDSVVGNVRTPIKFTYKPNGTIGDADVRCGIILVKYHNRSCHHRIFVRQGYAPLEVYNGGVKWYSYNNISSSATTSSPLDEGPRFRWGQWSRPIDPSNDFREGFKWGQDPGTNGFYMYPNYNSGSTYSWDNCIASEDAAGKVFTTSGALNAAHIAVKKNYSDLVDNKMQFAYGVIYGDGTTDMQSRVQDVYGYVHYAPTAENGQDKGMRGVFVYNPNDGRNIFFPIGASGFGRRKSSIGRKAISSEGEQGRNGVLRYSQRNTFMSVTDGEASQNAKYKPLFYDLFKRPGAIYWCRGSVEYNGSFNRAQTARDINFFTLDFGDLNWEAMADFENINSSDACYVRSVIEP